MARNGLLGLVIHPHGDDERADSAWRLRWRWRLLVLAGAIVVAVYYGLVVDRLRNDDASAVKLDDSELPQPPSRVTLQVEAVDLDPGAGSFDFEFRPVPRGLLEGGIAGELKAPLQVSVSSSRRPPVSFEFAEGQLIDPVSVSVSASTEASGFPFDRPRSLFRFDVFSDDNSVVTDIEMVDKTEGWNLSADVRGTDDGLQVEMWANRETLAISFPVFYIAGVVVVVLITLAVISGAVVRGHIEFNQVIWLGAMLVAIPTVRNEMPGVPPVGTAVDLFVFFPAIVVVGIALLAGLVLVVNETAGSRAEKAAEPE